MRANRLLVALLALVYGGCGGAGQNPLAPAGINHPPQIVRVELVGYNVAGYGEALPLRVEVRDEDGDTVSCRYAAQSGRVLIDGSSASSCVATYIAPEAGLSDRIDVTATDGRSSTASSATVALGGRSVPVGGGPGPAPGPTPTPRPAPSSTPGPEPTPSPQPTPPMNHNPTVTLTSVDECQAPCQITVTANASDADGDHLNYAWSGCAVMDGTTPNNTAVCAIAVAGSQTASVVVTDGRGGSASASRTLRGTNAPPPNRPPTVTATASAATCHPKPGSPCSVAVQAQATDPDGDALTYAWQGCAAGAAPAANCMVDALAIRTATIRVTDSHGASATASVNVEGTNQTPAVACSFSVVLPEGSSQTLNWTVRDDDAEDNDTFSVSVTQPSQGTQLYADDQGRYFVDVRSELCDICWGIVLMRVTDPWGAHNECGTRVYAR